MPFPAAFILHIVNFHSAHQMLSHHTSDVPVLHIRCYHTACRHEQVCSSCKQQTCCCPCGQLAHMRHHMHCDSKSGVQATLHKDSSIAAQSKTQGTRTEKSTPFSAQNERPDQTNSDLAVHHDGSLLRQQPRATYCKQICTCRTKSDQTRAGLTRLDQSRPG